MVVVNTSAGHIAGVTQGDVTSFLGIPFAEPPIGPRRFRPPQPPSRWTGVLEATRYGAAAPQLPKRGIFDPLDSLDEDCLSLNVWTPSVPGTGRPVLVWIHGGGLRGGSGSEAAFRGAHLAVRGDCVVVTVNYRLGALGGYIYLEELGDPRLAESANIGVLDQLMALEWVHDNIEAFGGDPNQVTIAGQSSGGQSVALFAGLPRASGLFSKAIAQSPAPTTLLERDDACMIAECFVAHLAALGIVRDEIALVPAGDLVAAAAAVKKELGFGRIGHPLHPVVDGRVIQRQPLDVIRDRSCEPVPLLAGSNRDELVLRVGQSSDEDEPPATARELAAQWADTVPGIAESGRPLVEQIASAYCTSAIIALDPPAPPSVPFFEGERMTRISAIRLLEAVAPRQSQTFSYLYCWDPPSRCGAAHCLELPLLFGTDRESKLGRLYGEPVSAREPISELLQSAWIAFIRTGDPNCAGTSEWPRYDVEHRATLLLDCPPRVVEDPWSEQRRAWDGVI